MFGFGSGPRSEFDFLAGTMHGKVVSYMLIFISNSPYLKK